MCRARSIVSSYLRAYIFPRTVKENVASLRASVPICANQGGPLCWRHEEALRNPSGDRSSVWSYKLLTLRQFALLWLFFCFVQPSSSPAPSHCPPLAAEHINHVWTETDGLRTSYAICNHARSNYVSFSLKRTQHRLQIKHHRQQLDGSSDVCPEWPSHALKVMIAPSHNKNFAHKLWCNCQGAT